MISENTFSQERRTGITASTAEYRPIFHFLPVQHPFAHDVRRFENMLHGDDELGSLYLTARSERSTIHAEIKSVATGNTFLLDRFYWSLQIWGTDGSDSFDSMTLTYHAKSGTTEWHRFPTDPYLPAIALCRSRQYRDEHGPVEIIRYVPLRRLTFRSHDRSGQPIIGKFKRRSRFKQAFDLLGAVAAHVHAKAETFRVARPLDLVPEHSLFFQEWLPGSNLALMLNVDNIRPLLYRVGGIHRDIHGLSSEGIPTALPLTRYQHREQAEWIAFCRPELGSSLRNMIGLLEETYDRFRLADTTFCHGDLACSQILVDRDVWSVTDFDLCHRGDQYRDMALFLASLDFDIPLFDTTCPNPATVYGGAVTAYLNGYQDHAGESIDEGRLLWHRLSAELYYLGLMLKKDRCPSAAFVRRLTRTQEFAEHLVALRSSGVS